MSEYGFYHLTKSPVEQALPKLLSKMMSTGKRVLLRIGLQERVEAIDRVLWSFEADSWLPHGTPNDPMPEKQPLLVTGERTGNTNGAEFLVVVEHAEVDDAAQFDRICELFDGNDPNAVERARQRWRWAKDQGFELAYWQQGERGGWRRAN